MLIIGLVGGHDDTQALVMFKLASLFGSFGVSFRLPDHDAHVRLELLTSLFDPRKMGGKQRLVLGNVKTPAEVDWVKKQGGYIAHVKGRPSDVIRMMDSDYYVAPEGNSSGRFVDPEECYSQMLLAYKKVATARRRKSA